MSEAAAIKFCRDCKWAKVSWFKWLVAGGWRFAKCTHRSALRNDARDCDANAEFQVTGRVTAVTGEAYTYCTVNRLFDCGPEAKFWEPRT